MPRCLFSCKPFLISVRSDASVIPARNVAPEASFPKHTHTRPISLSLPKDLIAEINLVNMRS